MFLAYLILNCIAVIMFSLEFKFKGNKGFLKYVRYSQNLLLPAIMVVLIIIVCRRVSFPDKVCCCDYEKEREAALDARNVDFYLY